MRWRLFNMRLLMQSCAAKRHRSTIPSDCTNLSFGDLVPYLRHSECHQQAVANGGDEARPWSVSRGSTCHMAGGLPQTSVCVCKPHVKNWKYPRSSRRSDDGEENGCCVRSVQPSGNSRKARFFKCFKTRRTPVPRL